MNITYSNQLNHIYYYEAGLSAEKENVKNVVLKFIDSLIYEKDKKSSEAYKIAQDVLDFIFNGYSPLVRSILKSKMVIVFFNLPA